jgi:hypothetical protein
MRVRVKEDSKVLTVTAFGGHQYIRAEWREVPSGSEEEALRHPYLVVEPAKGKPKPEATPEPEKAPEEAEAKKSPAPKPAKPAKAEKAPEPEISEKVADSEKAS